MTDEDAFQSALDSNPDDHTLRLVFADWLQERDDPRAEGYRALGKGQFAPAFNIGKNNGTAYWSNFGRVVGWDLPADWFAMIKVEGKSRLFAPDYSHRNDTPFFRRDAEDAAALAFSKLPAERRAELLGTLTPAAAS